jgi:hypothetical protein
MLHAAEESALKADTVVHQSQTEKLEAIAARHFYEIGSSLPKITCSGQPLLCNRLLGCALTHSCQGTHGEPLLLQR